MSVNDFVLVQGIRDTRATLGDWQQRPWPVLRVWLMLSLLIACGLLAAMWLVASVATPDSTRLSIVGVQTPPTISHMLHTLGRNSLVLALHATACVAGFIAGSSMPLSAQRRSGVSRWVHEKAGKVAIVFVVAVTAFSLFNQAYILGHGAATFSAQEGISPGLLILTLLPHAIPELIVLFLPLAAWLVASRRGEWHRLLAATFVTVAIAIPVLIATAAFETYVWPSLFRAAV